jgi:hypothetical protein
VSPRTPLRQVANDFRATDILKSVGEVMTSKTLLVASGSFLLFLWGVRAQQKPTIEVSSASYGLNSSKSALGNATEYLKSACDAKRSCIFAVKDAASAIGNSALGKSKDFDFVYRCGDKEKKGHIDGDSTGKALLLTCTD